MIHGEWEGGVFKTKKKVQILVSFTWRFKSEFNPSVLLAYNRVEKSLVFRQQKSPCLSKFVSS